MEDNIKKNQKIIFVLDMGDPIVESTLTHKEVIGKNKGIPKKRHN